MFLTGFKRVVRAGFSGFWRNGFVSLASVLVMVVALFVVGSVVFTNQLLQVSLDELKDKVDINVYFATSAKEDDVQAIVRAVSAFPEVARVEYVTREDALTRFRERHANDDASMQALELLDENPLGAVLNIKAKEPSQYEGVAQYLAQASAVESGKQSVIYRVNYAQNKAAIDRLTAIISQTERSSIWRMLFLIVVSLLVSFNTIRLAIFTAREEIAVMRLVGASNMYIRGPFIIAGTLYGIAAGIIALVAFYPVTYYFGPLFYPLPMFLSEGGGTMELYRFFVENFVVIAGIIFVSGALLGSASSYLAVRRHLRI